MAGAFDVALVGSSVSLSELLTSSMITQPFGLCSMLPCAASCSRCKHLSFHKHPASLVCKLIVCCWDTHEQYNQQHAMETNG
jgi:hypothetical protein